MLHTYEHTTFFNYYTLLIKNIFLCYISFLSNWRILYNPLPHPLMLVYLVNRETYQQICQIVYQWKLKPFRDIHHEHSNSWFCIFLQLSTIHLNLDLKFEFLTRQPFQEKQAVSLMADVNWIFKFLISLYQSDLKLINSEVSTSSKEATFRSIETSHFSCGGINCSNTAFDYIAQCDLKELLEVERGNNFFLYFLSHI